jgi:hypothetical protein
MNKPKGANRTNRTNMRKTTTIIALILTTLIVQAQDEDLPSDGLLQQNGESGVFTLDPGWIFDPGDPGDGIVVETDPLDGDGVVPVDGGLWLLLAAGAAYGARRLRRRES